jgi:hypothetical protein
MYVQISKNQVFDPLVCNGACNKYSVKRVEEKRKENGKEMSGEKKKREEKMREENMRKRCEERRRGWEMR